MKAAELNLKSAIAYTYFIDGEDSYWRDYCLNFFYSLVPEENRDFNLKILDNISSIQAIAEAVNTISMFGGAMVIVVKDTAYKERAEEKGVLNDILKDTPPNTYLVFVGSQFITAGQKAKMTIIDAAKSDLLEIRKMILKLADNNIESSAIDVLSQYTNRDMQRIVSELNKLLAYCNGKKIMLQDVKQLVANTIDNEMYEFTNAIAYKNRLQAQEILDRFTSKGVSYVYLLASLTGQYRRMLHSVLSAKSEVEIAKFLGIKEFAVKKAREVGKKYTKMALKTHLEMLINAEFSFKSGEMSEERAFKTVIAKMLL